MNKLQHLLLKLMEECNEVSQVASKCIQFSLEDKAPNQPYTNAERLNQELNDLRAQLTMLESEGFYFKASAKAQEDKIAKVNKYLKYPQELGLVDED